MVQCLPSMQKAPGMNPSIKNSSNRNKEMISAKHKRMAQAIQEVNGGVDTHAQILFFIPTLTSSSCLRTRLSQGRHKIKVQLQMSPDSIFRTYVKQ